MEIRSVALKNRPEGIPKSEDFQVITQKLEPPKENEIQVRNVCMSVDPYMRGRMVDRKSYVPPFQIGEVLTGGAIGRVIESNHPDFKTGDFVSSHYGWREGFTATTEGIEKLGNLQASPSMYLGTIGMPGMTAWIGIKEIGRLKEGETLFVSAASGAVGQIVGQMGRMSGCRVTGCVGSDEKVSFLINQRLTDTLCGTKVLRRVAYERIAANRSYFGDFDPFGDFDLIFGASKLNLKIVEVPVRYASRQYGNTQISRFRHGYLLVKMVVFAYRKLKAI